MDGFEKRRQNKKIAILNAALELFNQYGFDKVTISEIAKKASVSQVSIYNFFSSKDNLRKHIIKNALDENLTSVSEIIALDKPVSEKIQPFLDVKTSFINKISIKFFHEALESDESLKKYYIDFTEKMKLMFLSIIEKGKLEGFFDPGISNKAILIYINMFISYFLTNDSLKNELNSNAELAKELYFLFLDGLTGNRT